MKMMTEYSRFLIDDSYVSKQLSQINAFVYHEELRAEIQKSKATIQFVNLMDTIIKSCILPHNQDILSFKSIKESLFEMAGNDVNYQLAPHNDLKWFNNITNNEERAIAIKVYQRKVLYKSINVYQILNQHIKCNNLKSKFMKLEVCSCEEFKKSNKPEMQDFFSFLMNISIDRKTLQHCINRYLKNDSINICKCNAYFKQKILLFHPKKFLFVNYEDSILQLDNFIYFKNSFSDQVHIYKLISIILKHESYYGTLIIQGNNIQYIINECIFTFNSSNLMNVMDKFIYGTKLSSLNTCGVIMQYYQSCKLHPNCKSIITKLNSDMNWVNSNHITMYQNNKHSKTFCSINYNHALETQHMGAYQYSFLFDIKLKNHEQIPNTDFNLQDKILQTSSTTKYKQIIFRDDSELQKLLGFVESEFNEMGYNEYYQKICLRNHKLFISQDKKFIIYNNNIYKVKKKNKYELNKLRFYCWAHRVSNIQCPGNIYINIKRKEIKFSHTTGGRDFLYSCIKLGFILNVFK